MEKSLFISNFPTLTDAKIAFDVILKAETKLRNQKIWNKMPQKSSHFLSSELDVALNITGVKKATRKACGCGRHRNVGGHSVRTLHEWSTRLRNGLARILARSDGTITGLCWIFSLPARRLILSLASRILLLFWNTWFFDIFTVRPLLFRCRSVELRKPRRAKRLYSSPFFVLAST